LSLTFDPEIAAALAPMAESGFTPPAVGDIAGRRAMWEPIIGAASTAQPMPSDVTTSEHHATAQDGEQIKLRWYVKDGATPGPAVLFFHGGGYIFGHIDLFDGPVSRYVSASGVPFLSVEYGRAPEHPFPAPLEDAYAALRWLHVHAAELGVDSDRIGVMGDSAGGGMAAALTILARERGGPTIARQILLMPMLELLRLTLTGSVERVSPRREWPRGARAPSRGRRARASNSGVWRVPTQAARAAHRPPRRWP
jgi:acetyl esterase/lipase